MNLSKNEWDPLKVVLVGSATNAKIPWVDPSLRLVDYSHLKNIKDIPVGKYPSKVIEEANEDIEKLCDFLKSQNIEVLRPEESFVPQYNMCFPRHTLLVYQDRILACPVAINARIDEYKAYEKALSPYANITAAPRKYTFMYYNGKSIQNPEVTALLERAPVFDAANILKANQNLFYSVSNTGNFTGHGYLRDAMPEGTYINLLEKINYRHIDRSIILLREGLLLANPTYINNVDQLPEILRSWDIIWAPDPVDVGYHENYNNASAYVSMNLLSINPNLAVLEERQINLKQELKRYNIECVMMPFRHARTLGGGFHSLTLDVVRE